jgi:anti-sigma regulatory factor (Ser/Thr protein kinase)
MTTIASEMDEVTLQVESNLDAPSRSRSQLRSLKARLEPRYEDVVLVVSELVANSVRHGASSNIDVRVAAQADRIRVEVTDNGPGFSIDDPRGEGLGLLIVDKLADRWGMKNGRRKFTVWAELSVIPSGDQPG